MTFTVAELARVAGARLMNGSAARAAPAQPIRQVAVDSRCARPHALFVALPGARVDGHDFVAAALAAGRRPRACISAGSSLSRRAMHAAASDAWHRLGKAVDHANSLEAPACGRAAPRYAGAKSPSRA